METKHTGPPQVEDASLPGFTPHFEASIYVCRSPDPSRETIIPACPRRNHLHLIGETTLLKSGRVIPLPNAAEQRLCLDGDWAVQKGELLPRVTEFVTADHQDWPVVTQPGIVCIADREQQPKDIPDWHRRFMRHIHEDDVAILRKQVAVPAQWQGHSLHLLFEGVYPAVAVYVQGRLLDEHLSGLTPCSVNCSDLVDANGCLDIAVVIRRRYPNQEIDMPRHSSDYAGMHGSVYLYCDSATPHR